MVTVGNKEVRYPHLVEYGTNDTQAQPFFWPAVRANKKQTLNRIKREIRKVISKRDFLRTLTRSSPVYRE